MSRQRFEPLPVGAFIFRITERGKRFLPPDAKLPLPDFFRPTSKDEEQGASLDRPAGLSVWDRELCSVENAKKIVFLPDSHPEEVQAFGLTVEMTKKIGKANSAPLDVVAFPYPPEKGPGAAGHAHVEGLARPPGASKKQYKALRLALADSCVDITPL